MVQAFDETRRRARLTPGAAGRVPPHNLQAEESLLGAMLLSRDAIAAAIEGCGAGDFYKPAHGHIFEAVSSLYSQGEPADPITVADELRRAGLLDAIGGEAVLTSLQNTTPATSNAGRYAQIVEEHALLRRLISAAAEIAEIGYSVPDDVVSAVDRAESLMFEVADRRVTDTTRILRELLVRGLERIEKLYDRGEDITGVPTGYADLDQQLSGLQRSSLVIVGARPAMGKCVAWDTPIVDPITGAVRSAAEVYRRGRSGEAIEVLAMGADGALRRARPSAFIDDGIKPVFTVRTSLGREIRTTLAHPFLTPDGWRALADLSVGTPVAVASAIPVFGDEAVADDEVHALVAQTVATASGGEARIPERVYRLPRRQLAGFVVELFAMSGTIRSTDGRAARVYRCASRPLVLGLAHLLLRFGVLTTVTGLSEVADGVCGAGGESGFELSVMAGEDLGRFLALGATAFAGPTPAPERSISSPAPTRAGLAGRNSCGTSGRGPARTAVATMDGDERPGFEAPAVLGAGLRWDEIVAIEFAGDVQVYDLTVPGDHNFVAGDVLVHNTAFALGMAAHAAVEHQIPVLFFSLEMGELEITQRVLCAESLVEATRLRNGRLLESDWPKISRATGRLGEAPLYIDDNPNLTIMEVRAKARRLKSRLGDLGLIVIDYLQLMTGRHNAESRQVEIAEMSRGLKILARELEVPVVALSQLSRSLESRQDKRPMLSDLRESGSLEQDADVVMFIYRDEVYAPESADRGMAEIIVAKHRNGPTGTARLVFRSQYTRFDNMARGV